MTIIITPAVIKKMNFLLFLELHLPATGVHPGASEEYALTTPFIPCTIAIRIRTRKIRKTKKIKLFLFAEHLQLVSFPGSPYMGAFPVSPDSTFPFAAGC
jgi:hypothetical protein